MVNMIGQRIKDRRKELHITGAEIKEKTGISTGNLSSIENGKNLPSSIALIELSKVLNCSVDWILFGETPKSEISSSFDISVFEKQFINQFRELSDTDQEEIIMIVQMKYNRIQKAKERNVKSSLTGNDNSSSEIA